MLPLLETIEKGLTYIQNQLLELRYEESFILLRDVREGLVSIEISIIPMNNKLADNGIAALLAIVKENIDKSICNYGQGKEINIGSQIAKKLIPAFENLKDEIERVLRPYVVS